MNILETIQALVPDVPEPEVCPISICIYTVLIFAGDYQSEARSRFAEDKFTFDADSLLKVIVS